MLNYIRYFFKDPLTGFPRHHTIKKLANLFLNQISRRIFKSDYVLGYPTHVGIESTNLCNLQCPMCATGKDFSERKKGKITLKNYKKIIDEIGDYLYVVGPFNLGEPLLHEDIFEMISYTQQKNIATILGTNGLLITEDCAKQIITSGLEKLVISVDAATRETYEKNRPGGDFDQLLKNIKTLMQTKKTTGSRTPFVAIQMIAMKNNENEIEEFKKISKDLGVDKCTFTMFWKQSLGESTDEKKTNDFSPEKNTYKEAIEEDSRVTDTCRWAWGGSMINWDGTVIPCCYDYKQTFILGNAFDAPIRNIWNNPRYRQLRKEIKAGRKNIHLCRKCPLAQI